MRFRLTLAGHALQTCQPKSFRPETKSVIVLHICLTSGLTVSSMEEGLYPLSLLSFALVDIVGDSGTMTAHKAVHAESLPLYFEFFFVK